LKISQEFFRGPLISHPKRKAEMFLQTLVVSLAVLVGPANPPNPADSFTPFFAGAFVEEHN